MGKLCEPASRSLSDGPKFNGVQANRLGLHHLEVFQVGGVKICRRKREGGCKSYDEEED